MSREAYVLRMEKAVEKAFEALSKVKNENIALSEEVNTLKRRVKELEDQLRNSNAIKVPKTSAATHRSIPSKPAGSIAKDALRNATLASSRRSTGKTPSALNNQPMNTPAVSHSSQAVCTSGKSEEERADDLARELDELDSSSSSTSNGPALSDCGLEDDDLKDDDDDEYDDVTAEYDDDKDEDVKTTRIESSVRLEFPSKLEEGIVVDDCGIDGSGEGRYRGREDDNVDDDDNDDAAEHTVDELENNDNLGPSLSSLSLSVGRSLFQGNDTPKQTAAYAKSISPSQLAKEIFLYIRAKASEDYEAKQPPSLTISDTYGLVIFFKKCICGGVDDRILPEIIEKLHRRTIASTRKSFNIPFLWSFYGEAMISSYDIVEAEKIEHKDKVLLFGICLSRSCIMAATSLGQIDLALNIIQEILLISLSSPSRCTPLVAGASLALYNFKEVTLVATIKQQIIYTARVFLDILRNYPFQEGLSDYLILSLSSLDQFLTFHYQNHYPIDSVLVPSISCSDTYDDMNGLDEYVSRVNVHADEVFSDHIYMSTSSASISTQSNHTVMAAICRKNGFWKTILSFSKSASVKSNNVIGLGDLFTFSQLILNTISSLNSRLDIGSNNTYKSHAKTFEEITLHTDYLTSVKAWGGDFFGSGQLYSDIEKDLIKSCQQYWSNQLSSREAIQNSTHLLISFSTIMQSVFIEYDEVYGRWLIGEAGKGETTVQMLGRKRDRAMECFANLGLSFDSIPQTISEITLPPLAKLYWLASVNTVSMREYSTFLDTAINRLDRERLNPDFTPIDKIWNTLQVVLKDIATILSAVVAERLYIQSIYSLRGLILACDDLVPLDDLLIATIRHLSRIPLSFGGGPTGDINDDILKCISLLKSTVPLDVSAWIMRFQVRFPIFVINLERRLDRLSRARIILYNYGSIAVRIAAIDGSRNSDRIPETEAGTHWDSTLNASFDPRCLASSAIPLTASERGCIASHIKTWRIVTALHESPATNTLVNEELSIAKNLFQIDSSIDIQRKWYLICEDDIEISAKAKCTNITTEIRRLTSLIAADCDICYLGHVIPRNARKHYGKLFIKPEYVWQLHAYMLRPSTAKLLLSYLPCNDPVDNFIARLIHDGKLQACALRTQLFKQSGAVGNDKRRNSDIRHSGNIGNQQRKI